MLCNTTPLQSTTDSIKVSKFQKQIFLFSILPKNWTKFFYPKYIVAQYTRMEDFLYIFWKSKWARKFAFEIYWPLAKIVELRGRWQGFGFFWPPTPLRWHSLPYKRWQKVCFLDYLPTSSCQRSLWTPTKYELEKHIMWHVIRLLPSVSTYLSFYTVGRKME